MRLQKREHLVNNQKIVFFLIFLKQLDFFVSSRLSEVVEAPRINKWREVSSMKSSGSWEVALLISGRQFRLGWEWLARYSERPQIRCLQCILPHYWGRHRTGGDSQNQRAGCWLYSWIVGLGRSSHRRGDAFPNPCAGRRSHSNGLCCSHCTFHWLSDHNSSSSERDKFQPSVSQHQILDHDCSY